jgi:3-oxoacyl-[acyl-carrier protein] reductase
MTAPQPGHPVAVVTGASRGLGAAIADHLASLGYAVALCSRAYGEAESIAEQIARAHGRATLGAAVDVASAAEVHAFAQRVHIELGAARVIVNNAATLGPVGPLSSSSLDAWSAAIDVDLKGPAYVLAAFVDQLAESGGGRVIGLSGGGIGGPNPMQRCSAYVAAKAGLAVLTEVLADELAAHGATINAIAPGALPTGFLAEVVDVGAAIAGADLFADATSRGHGLQPAHLDPVLALLDYLISPDAGWLTGRVLSARWNSPESLHALHAADQTEPMSRDLFTLRRIDDDLYGPRS